MAIVVKDRVKVTAAAPGTGTITLGAAAAGFQSFAAIGDGNITYFAVVDTVAGTWEVNYGTYTSSGTTLTRNATPLSSSNAGALVNFTGTVDVFCTYPSEKAIYEEPSGNTLIDGGPLTVVGSGVVSYSSFTAVLAEMYGNVPTFAQSYARNLSTDPEASTDMIVYRDNTVADTANFMDMGINSQNFSSTTWPIFTPASMYLYGDGGEMFIGSGTDDLIFFTGGVQTTDVAGRFNKTTKALTLVSDANVGGNLDVTGTAVFGSTVTLSANPTTALEAATKQYVDNAASTGIHIHTPCTAETGAALSAVYTQGGTTFNITDITGTNTVVTSTTHGLSVNDQIWLYSTAGNGLSTNTAYFVYATPTTTSLQLSTSYGGPLLTGLTNASGLTYATRANSGVGAYLEASANAVLPVAGVIVGDRVLVYQQSTGYWNGVYTVTSLGSVGSKWKMTRATDADYYSPADTDGLSEGDYFFIQSNSESYVLTNPTGAIIIGYDAITYTLFSSVPSYTGGTNISVSGGVISLTGTVAPTNGGTGVNTVTTGNLLYGSATDTWSKLAIGTTYSLLRASAGGIPEWGAVNLASSDAVSGTLGPTYGGTGQNSYATGDTLYASASNTLSKLSGNTTTTKKFMVQTGTGSASQAPTWDVVNGSDVNGNISGQAGSVANALTAGTYLVGSSFNGSVARTWTVDATDANTASKVVARDASGNFSAGTITATLSGNATTATTATNVAGGAANKLVYQSSSGTTAFADAPSASGQNLQWNGSAFTWVAPAAGATKGFAVGMSLVFGR